MTRLKMCAASVGLMCVVGIGVPIQADANTMTVTAAIKAQDRAIKSSPDYRAIQHFDAKTVAQAKALIPKIAAVKRTIDHAATVVSGASATTSTQKRARAEWVRGTREDATGLGDLGVGIKDVIAGNKSAAKAAVLKFVKTLKAGDALETKADRALGLPTSD